MREIALIATSFFSMIGSLFGGHSASLPSQAQPSSVAITAAAKNIISATQNYLTRQQLLEKADNSFGNGNLPLGDGKYVTNAPKQGYIYLCNVMKNGGGAQVNGSWIHGNTWSPREKITVQGTVSWPNATFSDSVSSETRTLKGNGLPVNYTTGVFPIQSSDPAYKIDRNPNSIKAQNVLENLPANPVYLDTPYCMSGEVGIMLSGVAIFNGFDAEMHDAVAHEVQDSCDAHPQESGRYHYHGLSRCFKNIDVEHILGYALDGFPITGPKVAENKYLRTKDLDECHGITSDVYEGGVRKSIYHYVMTEDFPYSVSCFRGKPVRTGSLSGTNSNTSQNTRNGKLNNGNGSQSQTNNQPPQEALSACTNKSGKTACSFTTPRGDTISGTCNTDPQGSLVCVPSR